MFYLVGLSTVSRIYKKQGLYRLDGLETIIDEHSRHDLHSIALPCFRGVILMTKKITLMALKLIHGYILNEIIITVFLNVMLDGMKFRLFLQKYFICHSHLFAYFITNLRL